MRAKSVQRPIYRVPPSKYWAQYWYPWPIGVIATLQLIMTLGTISMESGNAVVDLFRSNVYSGFWSFPFMISATMATYACGKKKDKKFCSLTWKIPFSMYNTNTNESNCCVSSSDHLDGNCNDRHGISHDFYCN